MERIEHGEVAAVARGENGVGGERAEVLGRRGVRGRVRVGDDGQAQSAVGAHGDARSRFGQFRLAHGPQDRSVASRAASQRLGASHRPAASALPRGARGSGSSRGPVAPSDDVPPVPAVAVMESVVSVPCTLVVGAVLVNVADVLPP
jgi:hypothetical protein